MRVLVVHNRYRAALPSGENRVVDDEVVGLRAAGIEVATFFRSSDELAEMSVTDRLRAASSPVLGLSSAASFAATVDSFGPTVVHLHNPYPLISPRVVNECHRRGIPVVATIHNFRLRCMNGLFFRDGSVCTACEDKTVPWPGVAHGCYRGSRPQSAVMAAALTVHRPAWRKVSQFIAVSQFVADRMQGWGTPLGRISVKPNPVDDPGEPSEPGSGFLYAGRLSEEKGIRLLLDAWDESGLDGKVPLLIAGDGALASEVAERARASHSIELLGALDPPGVRAARRRSGAGVTCSLWFEAHPAVAESFAEGRPVLATRVGALGTVVNDSIGWLADPTPRSLAAALVAATDGDKLRRKGIAARRHFEATYESTLVMSQLIAIYEHAQTARR